MLRKLLANKCPQVSVLIVSNNTTHIRETIKSVLIQEYCNFDILIVLNGDATNESNSLSEEFEFTKTPIRIILCAQEDVVVARNLALYESTGLLSCIIDSDDLMPAGRIRSQVDEFLLNPNLVCLGGQLLELTESGLSEFHKYPTDDAATKHSLFRYSSLPQPGVMFLKDVALKAGAYSSKFPWLEDWDLWCRLSQYGEIYNLDIPTVYYRRHETQITSLYKKDIVLSTESMLYSILENLVNSKSSSNSTQESHSWMRTIRRQAFFCLVGLKRPAEKKGILGIRQVRRSVAGIAYQRYISARVSLDRFNTLWTALLTICIDPKFYCHKVFNIRNPNRKVHVRKSI